ncbi:lipoxygenase family protein [Algoriphagus sp.]|uniref:lipoxygenase family protein n=1 Tax=Algoriphagus sp. TaxID=1872435 RepID=UPI0025DE2AA8|nr:lipoxygenase family protein [Algoriphagus sp.]
MTHQEIKKIIKECREETKIEFTDKGSFFSPRFKSINHIEVGRSKIISSPITIILEFFYVVFKDLRNLFQKLQHFLFPRGEKCFGKNRNSTIKGRVTFAMKNGHAKPIHHMNIEFWARTWRLQWKKLGEGITDDEGYYGIDYDRSVAKGIFVLNLRMEVYQTSHIYFKDGKSTAHFTLFEKKWVRKDQLRSDSFMLENFRLDYWEYRADYPAPRVLIKDREKDAPQYYSQARQDALAQQFIPYELTKAKHLELIWLNSHKINLGTIQDDYPLNLSRCIEQKLPGYTRSDSYFGNRQMNGMNRSSFLPDPEKAGHFLVNYFGACQYETNEIYALPGAQIQFKLDEEGLPSPVKITLTGRLTALEKDPWKKRTFTPEDGEAWMQAKRIARVTGSFSTEVDDHFSGTHLNTEQYAIAAFRNLRLNPIANLLLPHLKEVVLINHTADKILLKDFLSNATALTEKGLISRTKDLLGVQDWKGFKPMSPISTAHEVAKADHLFWKITQDYVNEFIDSNLDEIKNFWLEIYRFSEDLLEHSVPVYLADVDLEKLSPELKDQSKERLHYYQFKYGFVPDLKRERINGELKAVSPITTNKGNEEISQEDIQNLKDSCVYMIFVATYLHTWINEHQYDELGELLFNGVGLRYGDGENGLMAPESDLRIAPAPQQATEMLWFVNLLSRTEFGFITRNEEGDVNPVFSKMLMENKEAFLKLDVEVENIESRTNI